jgi:hypothetical protein
MFPSSSRIRER